ncbi:MAG: bifunctional adenosylcobinamide kinase/adenosylcobinamide-phosphate guanylyltransferase [Ruminiclostridium sp.]|nr:bifunctional adenosylcobinamide kinase/adenosylcobinamide-phosphate guanylyltransferase [Ruminiclostridium sp.]
MGNITLVTGGAGSGKTRWAISYFKTCDNVLVLNTGSRMSEETRHRMEFSNRENNVEWTVVQDVEDPVPLIKDHKFFIFDSLGSYTSAVMRRVAKDVENITREEHNEIRKIVVDSVIECMRKVEELNGAMVIISIEPGFSVCPKDSEQVSFREIMGAVNQRIANTAQEVYLSASGIQFRIK